MATITRHYNNTMSSVQALENRCNFDELNLPGKLQSLKASSNVGGVNATVAIYEQMEKPVGVGNLVIIEASGGSNSAWIEKVNTKVSISRS